VNGLVTRNTWFHILAGLMTVGLKLANYLMCLRGFFIILLSISGLFGFSYCFVLGKEKVKLLPGASDTWLDIHSENKTSSFYNSNSAGTIDFSFFLLVYVYWLFLIHCVLSCDFAKESQEIWTHLSIQWIPRDSPQRSNVFVPCRNRVLQWMVT